MMVLVRLCLCVNLYWLVTCSSIYAQERCSHAGLSNKYDFKRKIVRKELPNRLDSYLITITVSSKSTKQVIQTVEVKSNYLIGSYSACKNVRSYETGLNQNEEVIDNDYGDLVIADFNFDQKFDFAVKREEGTYTGPIYNYYIQQESGSFKIDTYLSETVLWFPSDFDAENKILKTSVPSAVGVHVATYKFNPLNGVWKLTNKTLVKWRDL